MQFYTLNQILNLFEMISLNHAQINGYFFGSQDDISASQQEQYPLMWVDVIDSSIDLNTTSIVINCKIMDIAKDSQINEKDSLSDTLSIAQDVYAYLNNPIYQDYYILDLSTNLTPIREGMADKVNGWQMDLTFQLIQDRNRCQIPLR